MATGRFGRLRPMKVTRRRLFGLIAGAAATLMCLWFNFVDLRREQSNLHRYLLGEIVVTTIMAAVAAFLMSALHIPSGH